MPDDGRSSPLKHTCSWRDKLIVLWILNRQAKIFLRTTLLDNKSNKPVLYLKLSSYFVYWRLATHNQYTRFFTSSIFISNSRLKLTKNQANAEQHPEAELSLFENCWNSSAENNRTYSKKNQKSKCVCIHEIIRFILMKMKMKMKNRSHRWVEKKRCLLKKVCV